MQNIKNAKTTEANSLVSGGLVFGAIAAALALISACGGGKDIYADAVSTPTPTATATATITP